MAKGTLIEKTSYNLGLVIAANIPTCGLSVEAQEYYLSHREQIPEALRRGFIIPKSKPKPTPVLRLISSGKRIVIPATTGMQTIARAGDVFTEGIDSDFTSWGLDVPGEAKTETPVEVYEMVEDGDFKTIYDSLSRSLDSLCFTQEQAIVFVEDHKDWLRKEDYATFFLLKVGDKFFVAHVFLDAVERSSVVAGRFSCGIVWYGGFRLRFVVPQAIALA